MTVDVTIFHNPDCGTARNNLSMIRATGIESKVVEYLVTPNRFERAQMIAMIGGAGSKSSPL